MEKYQMYWFMSSKTKPQFDCSSYVRMLGWEAIMHWGLKSLSTSSDMSFYTAEKT
jgi:hypothetical protein